MMTTAHPTPSSAAAHEDAPARRPLELLEARRQRDTPGSLLRTEQAAMADFLVALAAFDARRGWELLGHASLFAFLHVELKLSKGAAYVRFSAARLIQSHPEALVPLRDGRLCLSSVGELGRVATPENFSEVLPRFFGCSSREAREAPPLRVQVTRVAPSTWPAPPQERPPPAASPAIELRLAPSPAAVAAALTFAAPVDLESVRAREPTGAAPSRTAAPSGRATAVAARGRSTREAAAVRRTCRSSTTWCPGRREGRARPPIFASSATATTPWPRGRRSEPGWWGGMAEDGQEVAARSLRRPRAAPPARTPASRCAGSC